jgi:hypothetical protein
VSAKASGQARSRGSFDHVPDAACDRAYRERREFERDRRRECAALISVGYLLLLITAIGADSRGFATVERMVSARSGVIASHRSVSLADLVAAGWGWRLAVASAVGAPLWFLIWRRTGPASARSLGAAWSFSTAASVVALALLPSGGEDWNQAFWVLAAAPCFAGVAFLRAVPADAAASNPYQMRALLRRQRKAE